MMAAITAKNNGDEVCLIEKNSFLGKKLLITGKGRCNITSSLSMEEFINNTPGNGMFLYSVYQKYTNTDIIEFLKQEGLEVKEERGNRIFPVTDKSIDVVKCFVNRIKKLNIQVKYNTVVKEILTKEYENEIKICGVKTNKETIQADKIILATGGKSYPLTGSTGDGYILAEKLGHKITPIKPSLVPLECYDKKECLELQGLSLKNIRISIEDKGKNKQYKNSLNKLLPQKLIPIIINRSEINPAKQVNEITRKERENLITIIKNFEMTIRDFRPIEEAIITSGGINIKEINPKTMESKKVKGLYFAGEIIDVDSYTGGFNLQIAYSTGFVAGSENIK